MSLESVLSGVDISIAKDIKDMLIPGEEVFYGVRQARIEQPIGPDEIFVTSERVIIRRPQVLSYMKNMRDYRYEDMGNVTIKKGFFNSTINIKMRFFSHNLQLRSIPNETAKKISGIIQQGIDGRFEGYGEEKKKEDVSETQDAKDAPLKILRERYARGEINREEYHQIRKDLGFD
ncbi:MAG: hypothetical protein B6U72_00950 [Candidatus Altiarchaeales archaeon ex4484_2]|nr:MAG: hypothetical protein B6U72_00950 [Candidatus Altiarchaeales archaeon ex4484_2]